MSPASHGFEPRLAKVRLKPDATGIELHQFTNYAYAAPTMIFLIRMYGEPCEMLLVCVG